MLRQHAFPHRWVIGAAAACIVAGALMLLFYVTTPRTSAVLPASTATRNPQPTAVALPATAIPAVTIERLGTVTDINVTYTYGGNFAGAYTAVYAVTNAHDSFVGQGTLIHYPVNANGAHDMHTVVAISFPGAAVRALLAQITVLLAAPPLPADVTPQYAPGDCFTAVRIALVAEAGAVQASARTCNADDPAQWVVTVAGRTTRTNVATIKDVFAPVLPFLRFDLFSTVGTPPTAPA